MRRNGKSVQIRNVLGRAVIVVLSLGCGEVSWGQSVNPVGNAQELLAHHLEAVATPAVLAGLKSRVVLGSAQFTSGEGTTPVEGKVAFVTEGEKMVFVVKLPSQDSQNSGLPSNDYRGEQFVFDGNKDKVALTNAQQSRSALGNFVFSQDAILREGLLGGVLSTAWPLADLKHRKAKLSFEGLKKIEGRELYDLRYQARGGGDLEIHLYFDPQTYRHVETTYSYDSNVLPDAGPANHDRGKFGAGAYDDSKLANGVPAAAPPGAGSEKVTAAHSPNRYRLQEIFSDFKTVDGFTVPTEDDIRLTQESQDGKSAVMEWKLGGLHVENNMGVDEGNFKVK
jgi:hypothetical protein